MARSALSAPHLQDEAAAFAYVEARLWPHAGRSAVTAKRRAKTDVPTEREGDADRPAQVPEVQGTQFTVRQGSIFESSHLPLHLWLQVIHLMCASKKGVSTRQIQRILKCSMKTAWFLTHRIREAMAEKHGIFTPPLGGAGKVIEADEAFMQRDPAKTTKGPGVPPSRCCRWSSAAALSARSTSPMSRPIPCVRSWRDTPTSKAA